MFNIVLLKLIILLVLSNNLLFAGVSGMVYQDLPVRNTANILELNTYGIQDTNELGVSDINVTAYPDNISTITDINGSWSLNTTSVKVRIEFSNIPAYLKESSTPNNHASVQFINDGDNNVLFGLHNPKDYSDTVNPPYVNNLQQNGTHIGNTFQELQTIPYAATGLNKDFQHYSTTNNGNGVNAQDNINTEELGSVWGKSYQKTKKRLFIASMLQRHIGFAHSPADIYIVDYSQNDISLNTISNFSLQGKTPSNNAINIDLGEVDRFSGPDYTLTLDPLHPNIDLDSYAKVGKISYGGIDIHYNSNTLWLVNLKQKAIISHDISLDNVENGATQQYLMSGQNNLPNCVNGELRPWALKIHEERGYIGAICDASQQKNKNDLSAHIYSFDINNPSNGFKNELNFDLNYTNNRWNAWEDTRVDLNKTLFGTIYPEPILSDIEFDQHNNMYLSFIDRYALQLGHLNYGANQGANTPNERAISQGEILKVCNNHNIYKLEGTGNCLKQDHQNLPFNPNDFEFFRDIGGGNEQDSSLGSLAILKGSDQILSTAVDPHPNNSLNQLYWVTQGVNTFSTKDGNNTFKRRTIKDNADNADLGFDYELLYWLFSLFVHSHPLSLIIEQKEKYPKNEIIEFLSDISRDADLLNVNTLGTMLWITTYLFGDILSNKTKQSIDILWGFNRRVIEEKYNIEWKIDKKIKLGSMRIGNEILLKRKQRK